MTEAKTGEMEEEGGYFEVKGRVSKLREVSSIALLVSLVASRSFFDSRFMLILNTPLFACRLLV